MSEVDTPVKNTNRGWLARCLAFLIDPKHRKFHAAIIVTALVSHLFLHYATYIPALRGPLGTLPYFRLHILHEAEFLLIVSYTGMVFGLKWGLAALAATAVTSVPFTLTPYIFGRAARPDEVRDLVMQVSFILMMGLLIVLLQDTNQKRQRAEVANEALKEAERLKDEFVSIAAHELRTPLTSLYGYTELLRRRDVPEETRQQWAERIHVQSGRLAQLASDLLDVSRMRIGSVKIERERVDLLPLMNQALGDARQPTDQHRLSIQAADALPAVSGDSDRLHQVLLNLVNNAVKYSPAGGDVSIAAEVDQGQKRVVVGVHDQGIGIAKEEQGGLFSTFHRIQNEHTKGIGGTGLGLYIVKSLVKAMGGEVWVKSEVGKGSSFYFSVPLWAEEAVAMKPVGHAVVAEPAAR